jgi:hypothetical protein
LQGITLGYADSDDGTSLKRRFATSRLRPNNAYSLGYLYTFAPGDATCRLQEGRLEPVVTLAFRPKVP